MFDLWQCVTELTHDLGGLLDAVIVPSDWELVEIKVNEMCLSRPQDGILDNSGCVSPSGVQDCEAEKFTLRLQKSELCSTVIPGKTVSVLAVLPHGDYGRS